MNIDYSILKDQDIIFVGLDSEYQSFKNMYSFEPKRVNVKDALHMAQIINSCRLFIGNQSMAFAIAEQLKVPRILEQYAHAPNVIPQGGEYFVCHTSDQFNKAISLSLNGKNYDTSKAKNTRETDSNNGC